MKKLNEATEVTILSHSVAAFVSTLEPSHLKHLANRIVTDTSNWLTKLFRYGFIVCVTYCKAINVCPYYMLRF